MRRSGHSVSSSDTRFYRVGGRRGGERRGEGGEGREKRGGGGGRRGGEGRKDREKGDKHIHNYIYMCRSTFEVYYIYYYMYIVHVCMHI